MEDTMIFYLRITIVLMNIFSLLTITEATTVVFRDCPSHQRGIVGKPYTIRCTIVINYVGIYWFEEFNKREPLIRYEDGTTRGRGYENNEYNIEHDGSLQINDVSEKHQMIYKVVVIDEAFNTNERTVAFFVQEESIEEIPYTDQSHQFGVVGKKGIIEFSAEPGFQGIYWYYQSNLRDPFIRYEDGTKLGKGYTDGEYDILPQGSLIIKKVTISHEMIYTVVVIDGSYTPTEYKIMFTAVVYPEQSVPHVINCTSETYCHVNAQDVDSLLCTFSGARPAVKLEWFQLVGVNKTVLLPSENSTTSNEQSPHLFDSSSRISRDTVSSIIPCVLLCKATGPAIEPNGTEQTVLVESRQLYEQLKNLTLSENVVNEGDMRNIALACDSVTEKSLIIWRSGESVEEFQTIIYTFYGNVVEDVESKIRINHTGHLILFNATQLHLGKVFVCIAVHSNSSTFGQIYKVSTLATVDPNTSWAITTKASTTSSESHQKTTRWSKTEETRPTETVTAKEIADETTELLKSGSEKVPITTTTLIITSTDIEEDELPSTSASFIVIICSATFLVLLVLLACVILYWRLHNKNAKAQCNQTPQTVAYSQVSQNDS